MAKLNDEQIKRFIEMVYYQECHIQDAIEELNKLLQEERKKAYKEGNEDTMRPIRNELYREIPSQLQGKDKVKGEGK